MDTLTYTIPQASQLTGISKTSIRSIVENGEIPTLRAKNGVIKFNASGIAMLIEARKRQWVCIVPKEVSEQSVLSWLKPMRPPVTSIVYFDPLSDIPEIDDLLRSATESTLGRVFVFNSNALYRSTLDLLISTTSANRADLTFVNSTSLS